MAIRDSQRARLYRAEWGAFEETEFDRIVEISHFHGMLEQLRALPQFARLLDKPVPVLVNNRRKTWSMAFFDAKGEDKLEFAPDHVQPYMFCHEISHIITWRYRDYRRIAAHGPEFAAIYIAVVHILLGYEASDMLNRCMRAANVERDKKISRKFEFFA